MKYPINHIQIHKIAAVLIFLWTAIPNYAADFSQKEPPYLQADILPSPFSDFLNQPERYISDGKTLRLAGDLAFLRGMLDQWAGDFKDRIRVTDDGIVTFRINPAEIKGNEAAQLLYELANNTEIFLLYAGTDAEQAVSFLENDKKFNRPRRWLKKLFIGETYSTGGGYFAATRGRLNHNNEECLAPPVNGIFAVIAINTEAEFFAVQGISDIFPLRDTKRDPDDLPLALSSLYLHEAAENLVFARQKRAGILLNQTAYYVAHRAAVKRGNKIFRQLKLAAFDGDLWSKTPNNKRPAGRFF
jgi:hypothetical protein